MSLLFAEGFDDVWSNLGVSTVPYTNKVYPSGATIYVYNNYWGRATGRYHGFAKNFANVNTLIRWGLPSAIGEGYVALNVKRTVDSAAANRWIFFVTDGWVGTHQIQIRFHGTQGQDLAIYRGGGTTLLATASNVFPINTDVWLSVRIKIANVGGVVEVKDAVGTTLASFSGDTQQTANATFNSVDMAWTPNWHVADDVICMDTTDSPTGTPFKGHLTERSIWTGFPAADGSTLQWTANGAANRWDCVDEDDPNDDTDYISTATPGNINLSTIDSTPAGMAGIEAVITQHRSRKDDAAARSVRSVLRRNAANNLGATNTLGSTYVNYQDKVYEVDPATGLAWVASDIDACELGMDAVS